MARMRWTGLLRCSRCRLRRDRRTPRRHLGTCFLLLHDYVICILKLVYQWIELRVCVLVPLGIYFATCFAIVLFLIIDMIWLYRLDTFSFSYLRTPWHMDSSLCLRLHPTSIPFIYIRLPVAEKKRRRNWKQRTPLTQFTTYYMYIHSYFYAYLLVCCFLFIWMTSLSFFSRESRTLEHLTKWINFNMYKRTTLLLLQQKTTKLTRIFRSC